MSSFLFALKAVSPIVLAVALGYFLKRIGIIPEEITKHLNRLVFRVFLPCNLFLNVYSITDLGSISLLYVVYVLAATLVIFLLSIPVALLTTKEGARRGVLMQGAIRSNYALIGIPLATSLFGQEGAIVATVLSAFAIPFFNVLAVITLTVFGKDTERVSLLKIGKGILKNPLIISIACGFLVLGVRALLAHLGITFRLSDITPVYRVAEQLSACATPVALLSLGAQFSFSAVPALRREILVGVSVKTVAVPLLTLSVAYLIGGFTGAHFASFVAIFATPVAVASVPMAQEMGADSRLAGQLVIFSTLVSAVTIFLFSFALKAIGIF